MAVQQTVVEVRDISKRYGGAQALAGVSLDVRVGEIHALVGENGAGKSTLGKIIAGVVQADAGVVRVDGREAGFRGPRDALREGIAIVEQELALVPAMTAAENVLLGYDPQRAASGRTDRERIAHINEELGLEVRIDTPVERLGLVDQQKVEILRAVCRGARLVVMDEPTARLPAHDSAALLELLRRVARRGTAVVFVSHFLEEVLSIADRVSVLRDGRLITTVDAAGQTPDDLVTAMLGRQATLDFPPKRSLPADAPAVLAVDRLSGANGVQDVSLSIRQGEIVALAGLVGSGRSEVARLIFGADARSGGQVLLDGEPLAPRSPRQAIQRGVAYLPESRKDLGLFLSLSSSENITLPYLESVSRMGVVSRRAEAREASAVMERLSVKAASPRHAVRTLSGGNQQKVLFAKWLWQRPRLLIADEPTRGVDVGAKFAIYELLVELAASGMSILLVSSELEEVLGLAHRVVVMRRGRQVATLGGDEVGEDAILRAAFGGDRGGVGEVAA